MTGDQPGTTGRAGESSSDVAEKLEQLRPERIVELEGFARLHCALHQVLAIRSRPESPGDGRDASCAVRVDAQAATSKVAWMVHITKGGYGDFEKLQPCKSDYTTTQNTYQTCPKRPR